MTSKVGNKRRESDLNTDMPMQLAETKSHNTDGNGKSLKSRGKKLCVVTEVERMARPHWVAMHDKGLKTQSGSAACQFIDSIVKGDAHLLTIHHPTVWETIRGGLFWCTAALAYLHFCARTSQVYRVWEFGLAGHSGRPMVFSIECPRRVWQFGRG